MVDYKCAVCGVRLNGKPALYCEGCCQYYCYGDGVPSGYMVWKCSNCAIEMDRVNL
ncbi:MAG: hypothetical protein QXF01_02565 [Candidatus Micrarchaeaceae archaeon]